MNSTAAKLRGLLAARRGHFALESGHHGDLWLDLDRLVVRPAATKELVAPLARRLATHRIAAVCGPLTGGAFLAQRIATELDAGFAYAERSAPRTPERSAVTYRVPDAIRGSLEGRRVAVVDDVINAGSAVGKTLQDLDACGAVPVAVGALLVLGPSGARLAADRGIPIEYLDTIASGLWAPDACPLCARHEPLEHLVP